MRVLAMTNLYPNPLQPHRAPFNRHQLRILNETCPVRVIAPIAWTDEWRLGRLQHRRVTLDGLTVDHPRYWYPPKLYRSRYGHWYRWSVRRAFSNAVMEHRPDIVFAPWVYPDGWAAAMLARQFKLPVVIQTHGSDVKLLDEYPAKKARTIEALMEADGVVAVSKDLAKDVTVMGATHVNVIYDGVDPELFFIHTNKSVAKETIKLDTAFPCVLYVGNLVAVKSVDVLLAAMKTIVAHVIIIGDGPLRSVLESQVDPKHVKFLGSLPLRDLPFYYQAADLFVLPSRSEGVPNVLLEASACGLPWIASNVGGIPEITHLGASRLVPPGDVAALRTAIVEMLANPPPRPNVSPRLRTEAVAELRSFLEATLLRYGTRHA